MNEELSAQEVSLLKTLWSYTADNRTCILQDWMIARESGLKRSRIGPLLKSLEEKKYIRRRTRHIAPPFWDKETRPSCERTIELLRSCPAAGVTA